MRGLDHYSMDSLFHVLRWEIAINTKRRDQWRLNDHFTCLYARLVMDREIDLKGYFEVRNRKAK